MSSSEQKDQAVHRPMVYRFRRRIVNPATIVYSVGFVLFTYGSWYVFSTYPTLWGAGGSLLVLCVGVYNLQAFLKQPIRVTLKDDHMEMVYFFHRTKVPYNKMERLHWFQHLSGLDSMQLRVLKIELKNGQWIRLDYMRGHLRQIRAMLEAKVYGKVV